MTTLANCKRLFFVPVLALFLAAGNASQAQGRVIINEFMAWPGEACPITAEFIELKNMGPGPMDIGCYVITDGDFAITIPANTILQPGEFYVLGGQNTINAPCANLSRNITVNLNWNTCGCTSGPIPTTDEGLMTDGGNASEQLVMFNPSGNVIDAVVRKLTGKETASTITSSTAGGCATFTFNLDSLNIIYEEIGESQGRGNSFARVIDGDCKWVKETLQNGGTTNNAAGEAATLSMSLVTTLNQDCITGNAVFTVNNASPASFFPMSYTLGYDANGNGQFNSQDIYTSGSDNTSPNIDFYNLSLGKYNIVIEPASGCNTQFFTFDLGPCITMAVKLKSFEGQNIGKYNRFTVEIETDNDLSALKLELSTDGRNFSPTSNIPFEKRKGTQSIQYNAEAGIAQFFRLSMTDINGKVQYSKVIKLTRNPDNVDFKIAPNPFTDFIGITANSNREDILQVSIISSSGQVLANERFNIHIGQNNVRMLTYGLPKGIYLIQIKKQITGETQTARIMKN